LDDPSPTLGRITRPRTLRAELGIRVTNRKSVWRRRAAAGCSTTRRSMHPSRKMFCFRIHHHLNIPMYTSLTSIWQRSVNTPRYDTQYTPFFFSQTPSVKRIKSTLMGVLTRRRAPVAPITHRKDHAPFCASARRSCSSISLGSRYGISFGCRSENRTSHVASHG
jgi:hypothetical protein